MKPLKGQRVGIGSDSGNLNYCEITKVEPDKIGFYVINGDWYGSLYNDGRVTIGDRTVGNFGDKIMFTFYPGEDKGMNYNEAIEYMKRLLGTFSAKRHVMLLVGRVGFRVNAIVYKLRVWLGMKIIPKSELERLYAEDNIAF